MMRIVEVRRIMAALSGFRFSVSGCKQRLGTP